MTVTKDTYRTLVKAIDTYGCDAQLKMVLEEMSELQKEICKFWRGSDNKDAITEEVADLEITLAQLKIIFGIETDVKKSYEKKMKRLALRLAAAKTTADKTDKQEEAMIITGNAHFESVCHKKLVEWYRKNWSEIPITEADVFTVWVCKTLQNYKCLVSTTISGDGVYAEYTFNGDKHELYEDVYVKQTNTCITEE